VAEICEFQCHAVILHAKCFGVVFKKISDNIVFNFISDIQTFRQQYAAVMTWTWT